MTNFVDRFKILNKCTKKAFLFTACKFCFENWIAFLMKSIFVQGKEVLYWKNLSSCHVSIISSDKENYNYQNYPDFVSKFSIKAYFNGIEKKALLNDNNHYVMSMERVLV